MLYTTVKHLLLVEMKMSENVHKFRAALSGAVSVWRAEMCPAEIFLRVCAVVPSGLLGTREHTAQFPECLQ